MPSPTTPSPQSDRQQCHLQQNLHRNRIDSSAIFNKTFNAIGSTAAPSISNNTFEIIGATTVSNNTINAIGSTTAPSPTTHSKQLARQQCHIQQHLQGNRLDSSAISDQHLQGNWLDSSATSNTFNAVGSTPVPSPNNTFNAIGSTPVLSSTRRQDQRH